MTPWLLYVLAVTDWAFAGYRHAAGRDGRIEKGAYYRRAVAVAVLLGHAPIAMVAGAVLILCAAGAEWSAFVAAGTAMVWVYGVYAAIVLLAFVPYLFGHLEIRTLATVSVFGPLTLLRPAVIVAGAVLATWTVREVSVAVAAALAVACHLLAEPPLARMYPLPRA